MASKRKRPNNVSPTKVMELPGDICKYCNKPYTEDGDDSKAIQCEICYSWVHATCDGLSLKEYDLFNQLSTSVSNIAYCCNKNHCYSRLNQLTTKSHEVSPELTQSLKLVVENHATLHESLLKVSSKVEELNIQNTELKKRINQLSVETKLSELKQELLSKSQNVMTHLPLKTKLNLLNL